MPQGEYSAILSTCIELPNGFKTFVFSSFEWPLKTGFIVLPFLFERCNPFRLKIVKGRNKHTKPVICNHGPPPVPEQGGGQPRKCAVVLFFLYALSP